MHSFNREAISWSLSKVANHRPAPGPKWTLLGVVPRASSSLRVNDNYVYGLLVALMGPGSTSARVILHRFYDGVEVRVQAPAAPELAIQDRTLGSAEQAVQSGQQGRHSRSFSPDDPAGEAVKYQACNYPPRKVTAMARFPVSDEVGAALGAFVAGGAGPRHSTLSRLFSRAGYQSAAPYDPNGPSQQMNKEDRVRVTISASVREPGRSRDLVEGLLAEYRVCRFFEPGNDAVAEGARRRNIRAAREAFARIDWELTEAGELRPAGVGAVAAIEGRPAIEEQLGRLRGASDDPALLLGTAKEMLESTAKYVLEEFSVPYTAKTSFDELWYHARDRLGLLPQAIDSSQSGAAQVREILQSSWSIARMANEVRNVEGTGHGRTLPTAMSADLAVLVVREACSIAQMVLSTLDRRLGR